MTLLEDKERNKCHRTVSGFSISPLFLSILMGLILAGLLIGDFMCYRSDSCVPSKTSYRIQFIILLCHLSAIAFFLFALVHATEVNLVIQQTLAKMAGFFNIVLFLLRMSLELLYIDYHPEDYVKD